MPVQEYHSLHLTPSGWKPCKAKFRKCRYKEHQEALIKETKELQVKADTQKAVENSKAKVGAILTSVGKSGNIERKSITNIPSFNIRNPTIYSKPADELIIGEEVFDGTYVIKIKSISPAIDPGGVTMKHLVTGEMMYPRKGYAIYGTRGDYWWVPADREVRVARDQNESEYLTRLGREEYESEYPILGDDEY